ncbi:unnamed protein product [Tetraodon nigroviridis]|uniref:(spotted green pufferfish) hypothetical protein n=1 Tax=Tetraodon nigroviridis TaxID=99883 RepID=Q4T0R1_TETNG|nr:unnamed protein product [Tetraodon nigroviridis]
MSPAWLLVSVALVGVARGADAQCWDHPSCQALDSEASSMVRGRHPPHPHPHPRLTSSLFHSSSSGVHPPLSLRPHRRGPRRPRERPPPTGAPSGGPVPGPPSILPVQTLLLHGALPLGEARRPEAPPGQGLHLQQPGGRLHRGVPRRDEARAARPAAGRRTAGGEGAGGDGGGGGGGAAAAPGRPSGEEIRIIQDEALPLERPPGQQTLRRLHEELGRGQPEAAAHALQKRHQQRRTAAEVRGGKRGGWRRRERGSPASVAHDGCWKTNK